MGETKPRQDMAFLALAAAVLAIAVALFVVMRSVSKGEQEPAPQETQQQVAEKPPELPQPEPTEGRDPFKSEPKGAVAGVGPAEPAAAAQVDLRFVGFTEGQGQGPMAIIRRGQRRYFVRAGETVRGYTVVSIGQNRVVLTGPGGEAVLLLREPEEEE
jgi:hypothetical protein